jgi:hypothetical protein
LCCVGGEVMTMIEQDFRTITKAKESELIELSTGMHVMGAYPKGLCLMDNSRDCDFKNDDFKCHRQTINDIIPPCAVLYRTDGMLFRRMKLSESTAVEFMPGQRLISDVVLADLVGSTEAWMHHLVETLGFDDPSCIALRELLTTVEFCPESTEYNPIRVLGPNQIAVNRQTAEHILGIIYSFINLDETIDDDPDVIAADEISAGLDYEPIEARRPGSPRCETCKCATCDHNSTAHCDFCDKAPE